MYTYQAYPTDENHDSFKAVLIIQQETWRENLYQPATQTDGTAATGMALVRAPPGSG